MRKVIRKRFLPRLWDPSTEHPPDETLVSPNLGDESPIAPAPASPEQNGDRKDAKKKKPLYKRPWFIALVIIILLAAIGSAGGSNKSSDDSPSAQENTTQESATPKETLEEEPAQLVSISAAYTGSTEAGTSIETGTPGIAVTGSYDDGTTGTLAGWSIDNPGTLQAGATSTFTVSCQGMTCTLDITCTTIDPEQYKASCVSYSYDELARNPDSYVGQNIVFRGQVIQVLEDSGAVTMRVNVTEVDFRSQPNTLS